MWDDLKLKVSVLAVALGLALAEKQVGRGQGQIFLHSQGDVPSASRFLSPHTRHNCRTFLLIIFYHTSVPILYYFKFDVNRINILQVLANINKYLIFLQFL